MFDSERLGANARRVIEEADPIVSVVAVWEIAIKHRLGRLVPPPPNAVELSDAGFGTLTIRVDHALAVAELPLHHADPFDRMLIAQARVDSLTLLSADRDLRAYDVPILDAAA